MVLPSAPDSLNATCAEIAFINLNFALNRRLCLAEPGNPLSESSQITIHGIAIYPGYFSYLQGIQIHGKQLHYLSDFGL